MVLTAVACMAAGALAQKTQNEPVTDSSVQSSPIRPVPGAPVVDSSAQASPIGSSEFGGGVSVAPHTAIEVRLSRGIDSGHLKNGQTVNATLANGVALSPRGMVNAGEPAQLTVVETLPAGRLYAAGEFSLQLLRIGSVSVYTNTLTYRGKPGHKDLPDSAPAVGTDAGLPEGAELTFHVLPPPVPANNVPNSRNGGPGRVNGVAAGGPPPPGSSTQPKAKAGESAKNGKNGSSGNISSKPGSGKTSSTQAKEIPNDNSSPQPAQPMDKSSPAPNQPAPPQNSSPTDTTQPHL